MKTMQRVIISAEPKDIIDYITFQRDTNYYSQEEYDILIKNNFIKGTGYNAKIILSGTTYIQQLNVRESLIKDIRKKQGKSFYTPRHPQASNCQDPADEKLFITSYYFEE